MWSMVTCLGHSISQARVLVQLPKPSSSIFATIARARRAASGRPCGSRASELTRVATTSIDDIIDERRKELFAEGQIAFDYWRNGKSITVDARTFGPGANENVLPIPKEELDISGDILKQNPGY